VAADPRHLSGWVPPAHPAVKITIDRLVDPVKRILRGQHFR
jgi:hypothetical protein